MPYRAAADNKSSGNEWKRKHSCTGPIPPGRRNSAAGASLPKRKEAKPGPLPSWSEKNRHLFELLLNLVDSLGLGLFAVIGVRTAIDCGYGEKGFLSIFVGVLTGVGGGMLRDTMAGEVPKIFRKR